MAHMVDCKKLGKQAPGLEKQPYPGELGQKIFENISEEAWQLWMAHQTILINENHLVLFKPEHRKFIEEQMEQFFFGTGAELPAQFVKPE